MIQSPYVRFSLALVALTLLWAFAHASIANYWAITLWSLSYLHARTQQGPAIPPEIAQALPPSHSYGRLWLAQDALERGDPDQAWTWLEPLSDSTNSWLLPTLGAVYAAQGRTEEAIDIWIRARDWRALYEAGNQALADNHLEDALAYRQALYRVDSEIGAEPLANTIWRVRQDAEAASDVLRNALQAYPDSWRRLRWLRRLGDFLRLQQAWDEAEAVYRQVLKENPTDSATLISLGWLLYERDNDVNGALAQFQKAIDVAPEQGEGCHAMGLILSKEKRYPEADRWFACALEREPDNRWWYRDRANAARAAGNLQLAIQIYQKAVERFPDFDSAYSELAWTCYLTGQYEAASQAIERAIALAEGRNPNHWARAGFIYEKRGQFEKALTAYERALQLAPDNRYARDGVNRLRASLSLNRTNP